MHGVAIKYATGKANNPTKGLGDLVDQEINATLKEYLPQFGGIPAAFLIGVQENGENTILIQAAFGDDTEKEITRQAAVQLFKEHDVAYWVLVAESWAVVQPSAEWDGTRPSEHPDRQEVVSIQGEDRFGHVAFATIEMVRDPEDEEKVSAGKIERHMDDLNARGPSGRFTALLEQQPHTTH